MLALVPGSNLDSNICKLHILGLASSNPGGLVKIINTSEHNTSGNCMNFYVTESSLLWVRQYFYDFRVIDEGVAGSMMCPHLGNSRMGVEHRASLCKEPTHCCHQELLLRVSEKRPETLCVSTVMHRCPPVRLQALLQPTLSTAKPSSHFSNNIKCTSPNTTDFFFFLNVFCL